MIVFSIFDVCRVNGPGAEELRVLFFFIQSLYEKHKNPDQP